MDVVLQRLVFESLFVGAFFTRFWMLLDAGWDKLLVKIHIADASAQQPISLRQPDAEAP
jgi:hypothetical protein